MWAESALANFHPRPGRVLKGWSPTETRVTPSLGRNTAASSPIWSVNFSKGKTITSFWVMDGEI